METPFEYCEKIARSHYENFPVGWFLPRDRRKYIYALYAFARTADDFADEAADRPLERLDEWGERLKGAAAGKADHPLFRALAILFRETQVPPELLADLLTAFRWDVEKQRYRDFPELERYCRYSANPIGRMVLLLFDLGTPERLALSDKICTGIQLVNHWQDVAVDLKKNRVYLPEEDLLRFSYRYDDLAKRTLNQPFRDLMRFEIGRTRGLFEEGKGLLKKLPRRLRWQIELMWSGPLRILKKIEKADYDIFSRRPTLSKRDIVGLFLRHRVRPL